jgi:hypothetical protein
MALFHALAKMSIELIAIFQNVQKGEIVFFDDFEALPSARNVDFAVAKCHFEGSELKNIFMCYQIRIIKKTLD